MPIQPEGQGAAASPFDSVILMLAQDGLNIKKAISILSLTEASILNNAVPVLGGQLLTRPGQTALATAGGNIHSVRRLNNPQSAAFTRFWGTGTDLSKGASGALSVVDSGYSGNPLTLVPFRPPLSGQSYLYIADTVRMSKINTTDNRLPIGLPKPVSPVTSAINATLSTAVAKFDAGDGTNAASWLASAGVHADGSPGVAPTISDVATPLGVGIRVVTIGGAAVSSIISIQKAIDLSILNGNTAATDDDEMTLMIAADDPSPIDEIRLYLVCSPVMTLGVVPGIDATNNTDAFVKAFRPNDLQQFITANKNTAISANIDVRTNQLIDQFVTNNANDSVSPGQNTGTFPSTTLALGRQASSLFGTIGLPLRRGEFTRIGADPTRGWNTITGLVITIQTVGAAPSAIALDEWYLTGGSGVDNAQPGDTKYDYRATNYDPRTGAESNPSDVQADANFLDVNRQPVRLSAPAFGDAAMRQRFYRRGGTLTTDWFFVGTNTSDGGDLIDGIDSTVTPNVAAGSDSEIEAAGAVEIDNDQPVTTVDASGNAVFNQPLRTLWGPVAGMLMGCGDPYRPGVVYWSKPGMADSWPSANWVEVCAPSEELMNGGVFGGQAFVFSRERGYLLSTNLAGVADTVVATPTDCTPGMASYWGITIGPDGIYYVAKDGVRVTKGGESAIVSDQLRPLFNGQGRNGLLPIDFTQPNSIRLEAFNNDIWFTYKDTGGTLRQQVYSVIYKFWRQVTFATPPITCYADPTQGEAGQQLLLCALNAAYTHSGTTDAGAAISCQVRTGALTFGNDRGETMFGDVFVDVDMQGTGTLTLQTYLNDETITNLLQTATGVSGFQRYLFDPFGTGTTAPQKARNLSVDLQWQGTSGVSPVINRMGVTVIPQPNLTFNRVTSWDTPGEAECYLMGLWIDADTGTSPRTIHIEYDLNGAVAEVPGSPFTVNPSGLAGRHKWWFSWPVAKANMIRIRPDDTCVPWELYSYRWIQQAEPPRIAVWDTNTENKQNAYCTGINIEADTFGLNKTVAMQIDGTTVSTQTINTNGRKLVQLAFTPVRGSVFRMVATDANVGLLYSWNWMTDPEPGTQWNWNQNYTVAGTLADKWLKGALIECDTFNVAKTVTFEVDGVVIDTETVTANGRQVVEVSFPQQLGRVFRMIPTDTNPGRLYSMEWIFDEEPLALSRWETQELELDSSGWKTIPASWITVKSSADVTLTVTVFGQSGTAMTTLVNTIPSTGGAKQKIYVPFASNKGMLYKFVFTSAAKFWLYREESILYVQPWGEPQAKPLKPFGNDDLDLVRGMHHAALTAGKSGGGSGG